GDVDDRLADGVALHHRPLLAHRHTDAVGAGLVDRLTHLAIGGHEAGADFGDTFRLVRGVLLRAAFLGVNRAGAGVLLLHLLRDPDRTGLGGTGGCGGRWRRGHLLGRTDLFALGGFLFALGGDFRFLVLDRPRG